MSLDKIFCQSNNELSLNIIFFAKHLFLYWNSNSILTFWYIALEQKRGSRLQIEVVKIYRSLVNSNILIPSSKCIKLFFHEVSSVSDGIPYWLARVVALFKYNTPSSFLILPSRLVMSRITFKATKQFSWIDRLLICCVFLCILKVD